MPPLAGWIRIKEQSMSGFREIPFGRPWITDEDRRAIMDVLDGPILTHGPQGREFEKEFAAFVGGDAHCVAVSSGMAALHLAYLQLGIGPGDEVIVPAQTHTATVHAVECVGARPIFVDCDPATGNLTASAIATAITPRTKAISVVHFLGIPCCMPEIMTVAEKHGLKVVEDCALALGSRYQSKHVGMFGDAACFSFYPVKHITTGEGGMFLSRHRSVAESVGRLRAFGVDRSHTERAIPGIYDVPSLGLNYRMSEINAALGRTQLRRIGYNLKRRKQNFDTLKEALGSAQNILILDARTSNAQSSHYCMSVVLEGDLQDRRDQVVARLKASGIGTSVYYPHPAPRLIYYREKYGYDADRYTEAQRISDQSVALPVGLHLSSDEMGYMAERLLRALKETGA